MEHGLTKRASRRGRVVLWPPSGAVVAFMVCLVALCCHGWGRDNLALANLAVEADIVSKELIAPPYPGPGDTLLYRVAVHNRTDDLFHSVTLDDRFDVGCLRFVGAEPPPTQGIGEPDALHWADLGPLPPGEDHVVHVEFALDVHCNMASNCVGARAWSMYGEHVGQTCVDTPIELPPGSLALPLVYSARASTTTPTATATPSSSPSATPGVTGTATSTPTTTPTRGSPDAWVVNTTDDTDDGACDAAHCSLREAIKAANASSGGGSVSFAIPAGDAGRDAQGVCWIRPATELPRVTGDWIIVDGYTQPGASAAPRQIRVVLDGQALGNMDGLVISGAHNTVRGLCVQRFTYRNGIAIVGTGYLGNRIEGCNVGTGLDGTTSQGNCANGFWCAGIAIGSNASGNTIGPDNLIAYNYFGVWINPDATGNTITRNAIWGDFGQAIKLVNANKDIAAPTIQRASATQVSGTACAGCTIEVFSDEGSQARYYEGTTTSDGSGLWALNLASPPQGSHVTATSTDGAGNTSTLSDFVAVEP